MSERRKARLGLKVMHHHHMAGKVYRRLSDLVFTDGRARALMRWIDLGGVRTPLCVCELDPAKLVKLSYNVYRYEGVTEDPFAKT